MSNYTYLIEALYSGPFPLEIEWFTTIGEYDTEYVMTAWWEDGQYEFA